MTINQAEKDTVQDSGSAVQIQETGVDAAAEVQTPSIQSEAPPPPAQAPEENPLPDFKKPKKKRSVGKWIALVLVVAVAGVLFYNYREASKALREAASTVAYEEVTVGRQDITVTLSGSAALSAADNYMVTTLISGEILSAPFEEGDTVQKDDILYVIDASDISSTIERAELTVSQSRQNYNRVLDNQKNLNISTKEAATLVTLLVKEGDTVVPGQAVAMLRDSSVMSLQLPFGSDDAQQFTIGQAAQVTLDGSYETLTGTVSEISRVDQVLAGNMLVRLVTIDVVNPGGISPNQTATAMVGDMACNNSGAFAYKSEYTLTAATSADVSQIRYKEGDWIPANTLLLTLESTTLNMEIDSARNSLRDAEINLENQRDRLESYTIKSPISGTIIEKSYKEGDTLESGRMLCTIFDLSYLSLTLNIDELDIAMVEEGQEVTITADAVQKKEYTGVVTKVNINGTTFSGVTSYPVTVRLEGDIEGLLPGMNADATIIIADHPNTLAIPNAAVHRGDRVMVHTGNPEAAQEDPKLPPGFEYREVELGANDDDFIQVISGLEEGDLIAVVEVNKDENYINTPFGSIPVSSLT